MKQAISFFIFLFACLCTGTQAAAQDEIRVASWNIEDFNYYKARGRAYLDFTQLSALPAIQYPIDNLPVDVQAGIVINKFMDQNKIDILFLQEFIPFAWETRPQNKIKLLKFDEIPGLDQKFTIQKFCYYDKAYLKKHWLLEGPNYQGETIYLLEGFSGKPITFDDWLINQYITEPNYIAAELDIPTCGECYAAIYRKENESGNLSLIKNIDYSKFETFNSQYNNIRPPAAMGFTIAKTATNANKYKIEKKDFIFFNYHAKRNQDYLKAFNTLKTNVISFTTLLSIESNDKPIFFLGDLNREDITGALPRQQTFGRKPIDYIYANLQAKKIASKLEEVNAVSGMSDFKNDFYSIPLKRNYKYSDGRNEYKESAKHFSDHNPIYTTIRIGGDITSYTIHEKGTPNEAFALTDNDLILTDKGFCNKEINDYGASIKINYSTNKMTAQVISKYTNTQEKKCFWKFSNLKEKIKTDLALTEGVYNLNIDFYFGATEENGTNALSSITKKLYFNIPGAGTAGQVLGNLRSGMLGAAPREKNLVEKKEFKVKNGDKCEVEGDNIWITGVGFDNTKDAEIRIEARKNMNVDKSDIDSTGYFELKIGNASSFSLGEHSFEIFVDGKKVTGNKFVVRDCKPKDDDKAKAPEDPSAFCRAFAVVTEGIKDIVNFFSFTGEYIDMVKITDGKGCVKGLENLAKVAVTVGVEYYTRGASVGGQVAKVSVRTFIPKIGKMIAAGITGKLVTSAAQYGVSVTDAKGYLQVNGDIKDINCLLKSAGEPVVYLAYSQNGNQNNMHIISESKLLTEQAVESILEPKNEVDKLKYSSKRVSLESFNTTFRNTSLAELQKGQFIFDEATGLLLIMQLDNNLVLYKITGNTSTALAHSGTDDSTKDVHFRMSVGNNNGSAATVLFYNTTGLVSVVSGNQYIGKYNSTGPKSMLFEYEKTRNYPKLLLRVKDNNDFELFDQTASRAYSLTSLLNKPAQVENTKSIIEKNRLDLP